MEEYCPVTEDNTRRVKPLTPQILFFWSQQMFETAYVPLLHYDTRSTITPACC
jgi:hypothetical protein